MKSRVAAVILAVTCCGQGLNGQQRPAQPEATFRVQVEAVELDAVVTDAQGNLVTNLTKDDFQILEDGKPQTITSFGLVNIPVERAVRPLFTDRVIEPDVQSNNQGEGRLFVFALDDVDPEQALRTRRFLRRFLEQYFGANDLAAVVYLGRQNTANSQDLTNNPRLLLKAIDRFTGGFREEPSPQAAIPAPQGSTTIPPAPNFEGEFNLRRAMGSLRGVVEFMAGIHGRRKALLLFSQGYPLELFRVIDYRGGTLTIPQEDLHKAITAATRNNVTIYPIDPRGLTSDGGLGESETGFNPDAFARMAASHAAMEARQSLSAIADVTGGFALTNSNSFDQAFSRIVAENSTYYVLGFSSTNDRRDGRFRRLQVRVTRPGLVVRTRGGYMAPLRNERPPAPPPASPNMSPALADALRSSVAVNGVPIRVFAAPFKGSSREATVVMAIDVEASQLGFVENNGGYAAAVEVSFLTSDARNKIFPGRTQSANLTLKPDTYARVMKSGIRTTEETQLPPGRYQVRVAAGNRAGKTGSVVYDLEVPDFSKGPLAMSGVVVSAQSRASVTTLRPEQFLANVLPGPMTALRDFENRDTVAIFAEAYENVREGPPHAIDLIAELREEGGRSVKRVAEQRSSSELQGRSGGYGITARFPLEGLQAGVYVIHVEAQSSGEGRPTVSKDIQIRVR